MAPVATARRERSATNSSTATKETDVKSLLPGLAKGPPRSRKPTISSALWCNQRAAFEQQHRQDEIKRRLKTISNATKLSRPQPAKSASRSLKRCPSNAGTLEDKLLTLHWVGSATLGVRPSSAASARSMPAKHALPVPRRVDTHTRPRPSSGQLHRTAGGSGGAFRRPASAPCIRRPEYAEIGDAATVKIDQQCIFVTPVFEQLARPTDILSSPVPCISDPKIRPSSYSNTFDLTATEDDTDHELLYCADELGTEFYSATQIVEDCDAIVEELPELAARENGNDAKHNFESALRNCGTGFKHADLVGMIIQDTTDSPDLLEGLAGSVRDRLRRLSLPQKSGGHDVFLLRAMLSTLERKQQLLADLLRRISAYTAAATFRDQHLVAAAKGELDMHESLGEAVDFGSYVRRCANLENGPQPKAHDTSSIESLCRFFRLPRHHDLVLQARSIVRQEEKQWLCAALEFAEAELLENANASCDGPSWLAIERMIELLMILGIPKEHADLKKARRMARDARAAVDARAETDVNNCSPDSPPSPISFLDSSGTALM